jgi:osmoprotectant transport system permease protein
MQSAERTRLRQGVDADPGAGPDPVEAVPGRDTRRDSRREPDRAVTVAVEQLDLGLPQRRSLRGWLVTPAVLAAVLLALWAYVAARPLDSIEERRVNLSFILQAAGEHVTLTLVSTLFVLLIAVPVGIVLTRPFARRITGPAVAVFNIGQAIPSIGVLVLLAIVWGIGFWPAVVALVAYSALPVLRNTMIGLRQVDEAVIEAGRGMGMSRLGVLRRIELPLAVPVILTRAAHRLGDQRGHRDAGRAGQRGRLRRHHHHRPGAEPAAGDDRRQRAHRGAGPAHRLPRTGG